MDNSQIMDAVGKSVEAELKHSLVLQRQRYTRIQPQSVLVPCFGSTRGDSASLKVFIAQDGDFTIQEMGISVRGLVDINGRSLRTAPGPNAKQTAFPSGLKTASGWDISSSGLLVQITEAGSTLKLTDGYVDISAIASPGYLAQGLSPLKIRHTLRRNSTLLFEFRNRDDADQDTTSTDPNLDLFHAVSVALIGQKYSGVSSDI